MLRFRGAARPPAILSSPSRESTDLLRRGEASSPSQQNAESSFPAEHRPPFPRERRPLERGVPGLARRGAAVRPSQLSAPGIRSERTQAVISSTESRQLTAL